MVWLLGLESSIVVVSKYFPILNAACCRSSELTILVLSNTVLVSCPDILMETCS